MADGRKLREKLVEQAAAFREDAQQEKKQSAGFDHSA